MKKRFLVLENGAAFEGYAFGADVVSIGEAVFTTACGSYIETLTDPSYYGQIIVQTFPQIGNYGIITEDFESDRCYARGYVVRDLCCAPSNFRTELTLDAFLKEQGIPGIYGIDTRALTKQITANGVMNAILTDNPDSTDLEKLKSYKVTDALRHVSTKKAKLFPAREKKFSVALLDYGCKKNIIRSLQDRGCEVTLLPHTTTAGEILSGGFDGVMLSNGPGDPSGYTAEADELKGIIGKLPLMAICLGHQLLAIAMGGKTEKLRFGHRGANHPVRELATNKMYITSQNHGYAVISETMDENNISFNNNNDGSCEGIDYPQYNAFSVQFHPEACGGPLDTAFLFDRFIAIMEKNKK